jgi:hypothetical protein
LVDPSNQFEFGSYLTIALFNEVGTGTVSLPGVRQCTGVEAQNLNGSLNRYAANAEETEYIALS